MKYNNWFIDHLYKDARGRRFSRDDRVRYFTEKRKGKGKNVVLTPAFSRGTVVDFDNNQRVYKVRNNDDEIVDIHPRNLIPEIVGQSPIISEPQPEMIEPVVH